MTDVLYQPTPAQIKKSQLTRFAQHLEDHTGQTFNSYSELHRFSIEHMEAFWREVWNFSHVRGDMGKTVLEAPTMPGARWFPEARLNFADNLLSHGQPEQSALICLSESRPEHVISYAQLHQQVMNLAAYFKVDCQIQPGDRIAAYLGNTPEAIIAMLATSYIGAVWTSASPDFGLDGALDRFSQIEPKLLIAGNGYRYGGKDIERQQTADQLRQQLPTVTQLINVQVLPELSPISNSLDFDTLANNRREPPPVQLTGFDHPLYILYSSGTTGKPKCIVHGAGGTLLQHLKEHQLHGNISDKSVLFYYTTTGWMMWNWLVSGLASGATLVLYDGNPMYPQADILWQYAANYGFTHFGTSAKYLSACRKQQVKPAKTALRALKVIFSTGSPLASEDFDWVYQTVKKEVLLHSISGGTDIVSCFVGGNPWLPVVRGKIQAANLGMAVESWDENGSPVVDQRGELVCTRPAPCMPVGFWNDPDNRRYRAAYFERFPGVWAHGDFCTIDEAGQVVILGRSDTTLNPGGIRIGTAEIYRQIETLASIQDSLVVGRPIKDDTEVVLFVVTQDAVELDDDLIREIKARIRSNTTPRHVPAKIIAVSEIPYTRSGKKVELAVSEILRGDEPKNITALANADALDQYRVIARQLAAID